MIDKAVVYVFSGPPDHNTAAAFASANIVPVLNSLEQIGLWKRQKGAPAALHVDTGMQRLGLDPKEAESTMLEGIDLVLLMSHLADRKSVGPGKSGDTGGRRSIHKKT